jgi:NADH-quinone oxidoreductase subunit J
MAAALFAASFDLMFERWRSMLEHPHAGLVLRSLVLLASGSAGIYLMLPRGAPAGRRFDRFVGGALVTLALILLMTVPVSAKLPVGVGSEPAAPPTQSLVADSQETIFWRIPDPPGASATFYVLAVLSLASAVMMITSRNPVYSALWFAMVLLGNSGLFLLQGAEFLSAATIIVYAGAIVVTFLFVIMLAQPDGAAPYDRWSREPFLSSLTGLILASVLCGTLHHASRYEMRGGTGGAVALPAAESIRQAAELPGERHVAAASDHVARLGKALFLDHVVSVEVIGVLLLVAVVGAVLIAGHPIEAANRRGIPK